MERLRPQNNGRPADFMPGFAWHCQFVGQVMLEVQHCPQVPVVVATSAALRLHGELLHQPWHASQAGIIGQNADGLG
eukprot:3470604-Lingulodinium_polyedra.AAC.1